MDIYDYLKADHQKVKTLFKQFENNKNIDRQEDIFEMLKMEILVHAKAEQNTFYKILEQFKKSKDEAEHGEKEHDKIEQKLKDISKLNGNHKKWQKEVLALKDLVNHHVSDEEGKMFRAAKKVLTKEEANKIKEMMHDYKGKLWDKME